MTRLNRNVVSNRHDTSKQQSSIKYLFSGRIRVGYSVNITTMEGEGMVNLTIQVFSHPVDGAPRPFTLSVSTQDGTAGMAD